jgi:hypothetical protein
LDHVEGHVRAPTKPSKLGVYDSGGVSYLSHARGSYISCSGGGIHHVLCGVLQVRIWRAIASISPLLAVVLRLGATSLDSFRDLAYGSLRDPV